MKISRVLLLGHTVELGGAELSVARFLRSDAASGYSLGLLSPDDIGCWKLPSRVPVYQTAARAGSDSRRAVVRQLDDMIKEVDPDVVVCNSSNAAQYLALVPKHGRRFLYFLRREAIPVGLSPARKIVNTTLILRRFDGFLANSRWTADTLPRSVSGRRPVLVSVPVSGVSANGPTRSAGSPTGQLACLSLSRLSPWKGVHTAIESVVSLNLASDVPRVSLVVAGGDLFGESEYSRHLHDLAQGGSVVFAGHVNDIEPLLAQADVLFCLSVTPEPFGQVVVQGMARGCAVVATAQGGPAELIENGVNGFLVDPNSPEQVVEVLERLASDDELLERISRAAIESSARFTDEVTIPQFAKDVEALTAQIRRAG